jgi:hypothetical protein
MISHGGSTTQHFVSLDTDDSFVEPICQQDDHGSRFSLFPIEHSDLRNMYPMKLIYLRICATFCGRISFGSPGRYATFEKQDDSSVLIKHLWLAEDIGDTSAHASVLIKHLFFGWLGTSATHQHMRRHSRKTIGQSINVAPEQLARVLERRRGSRPYVAAVDCSYIILR